MNKIKPSSDSEMITKFIGIQNSSLLTDSPEKAQESIEGILLEKLTSQNDQAIGDNLCELKKI